MSRLGLGGTPDLQEPPPVLGRSIGRLNTRTAGSYPLIESSSEQMLIDFFRQPNADLEQLIGVSVPEWAA
jgi:hypothetical protein